MTSHVETAVQARIAAAKAKTQQQRDERAAFGQARAAGLEARKANKLRRIHCATCAWRLGRNQYYRCPLGCGAAVCRKYANCGNTHLRQCDNRPRPETP
jgi:hypothetical protein